MLQIRLRRDPSTESTGGPRPIPAENVTVACPDHLVIAELPVAKGIGSVTASSVVKTVGRRSRRQLGERVHFCVRCDFPIAIYGRLSPCEHAYCLECARSDSICYLCEERIQKIQTIKMMEGIFICAAPHCLKSFLKKTDFESHIHGIHADLLQPNAEKEDGNDSDVQSTKQSSASESTLRGPARPVFSPGSNSQQQSREQLLPRPMTQPKAQQPVFGQVQNFPADSQADSSRPPGFERPASQTFQQESNQFPGKQPGILQANPFPEYPPVHSMQPLNFAVPMNQNPVLPPQFGFPPYPTDGTQPFYGSSYEMPRSGSAPEAGSEQGSLLGFPPGPMTAPNFTGTYPQTWNPGLAAAPFEAAASAQGVAQGGNNNMDPRDGKGILASQPLQAPQPPPPPTPSQQLNRGQFYPGDVGHDTRGFGWQHENRDGFGGSQE